MIGNSVMKELTYRKLMGQLRELEITEGVEQYSFEIIVTLIDKVY